MAKWEIAEEDVIDYSASGDDIDSFSQKVKRTFEKLYLQLNAQQPISCGLFEDRPESGTKSYELYFDTENSVVYIWTGFEWKKFLSLNFADMLNYEKYCLSRDELTQIGGASSAGKILQLDDETGKANVDITGSPDMLWGYFIDFQDLKNGDIVSFDATKKKFVNRPMMSSQNVSAGANAADINHLKRLVGELHLALAVAGIDNTGYDSMATEVFFGDSEQIDTTSVAVTSAIMGSNDVRVASLDNLIVGGNYQLADGNYLQDVVISTMTVANSIKTVTLTENIKYPFSNTATVLRRSNGALQEGYITGDGVSFMTEPISFVNELTGEGKKISSAHLNVKHENVNGADISAEIALIHDPKFVNGEVIGIATGSTQTVTLANADNNVSSYGFKLFYGGVEQTSGYTFSPSDGKVTFSAPSGVVVMANYYYNWSEEVFIPMLKNGTFNDKKNIARATTQFVYQAANDDLKGSVAVIRLTLNQAAGGVTSLILGKATGSSQGFKLPNHAIEERIQVFPSSATWSWLDDLDVLLVTAPKNQTISTSYIYKSKPFKVDSFAVMFNE